MIGIHGQLLMITAAIHVLFGLMPSIYLHDWKEFFKKGLWNQVFITDDRKVASFWFVMAGPLFFTIGLLIYEIEVQGMKLPVSIGWSILATSLVGVVLCPKSGFTIFILPQAIFYLFKAL